MARIQNNEKFSGDNRLWFFEIINDKLRTTQRLKLPSKFVKNISEVPDTVTLKGPSGDLKHVKLSKKDDGIYLKEGWRQFVRDNSLGKDEFLIFRYSKKQLFDIQIFERTAVERIQVDTNRGHQGCSSSPGKKSYDQHTPCEPSRRNKAMSPSTVRKNQGNGKDKIQTTKTLSKDTCKDQRLPPRGKERASLPRALESFTSTFPYFCVCMSESYVEGMHMRIPKAFAQEHLTKSSREMILKNSEGKSWKVNCVYSMGTNYISKGWSAFVSASDYKVGNICIFELVAADILQVHVFR